MKKMDMLKDIVRAYKNYPDYVAFVIDDTSYTYQEVFARVRGIMPFVQDCPEDIIGIIAAAVVSKRTPLSWLYCYPGKLT